MSQYIINIITNFFITYFWSWHYIYIFHWHWSTFEYIITYSLSLAPQSGAHRITPHRDFHPTNPYNPTHPSTYSSRAVKPWKDPWCDIFLKRKWYEDLKNNVPKCLTSKYTNMYKYTNTVWVKFADRPIMCYIFENVMVRGPQKQCSQVSDIQIQKYKYANTQIQLRWKLQIDLTCAIFF